MQPGLMFKQLFLEWKSEARAMYAVQYNRGSRPPWGRMHNPEGKICHLNEKRTGVLYSDLTAGPNHNH